MPNKRRRTTSHRTQQEEAPPRLRPLWAAVISVVAVAVVVGAGIAIDFAQRPDVPAALAGCRPGRELAPTLYQSAPGTCVNPNKKYQVDVETTKGKFTLQLLPRQAPRTVSNFVALAGGGYYTGLTFFDARDWEVRAGDPTGTGHGGPGYTLPAEPIAKGESWSPGAVGMARLSDGSLSGSQFFILRTSWSGGKPASSYNHFANVSSGLDVVTQLSSSDRILRVTVRQN
jgi:cyclophilin family peptidyl-prolyl cis-trans isomerase